MATTQKRQLSRAMCLKKRPKKSMRFFISTRLVHMETAGGTFATQQRKFR